MIQRKNGCHFSEGTHQPLRLKMHLKASRVCRSTQPKQPIAIKLNDFDIFFDGFQAKVRKQHGEEEELAQPVRRAWLVVGVGHAHGPFNPFSPFNAINSSRAAHKPTHKPTHKSTHRSPQTQRCLAQPQPKRCSKPAAHLEQRI